VFLFSFFGLSLTLLFSGILVPSKFIVCVHERGSPTRCTCQRQPAMLLITGSSRRLSVILFWVLFWELEDFLLVLHGDLSVRTVRCGHRLGLHRCHWSHILVHQHLTGAPRVWLKCEFALQSLAILAKQHCNRIAGVLEGGGGLSL
jgi:hypothetical protein